MDNKSATISLEDFVLRVINKIQFVAQENSGRIKGAVRFEVFVDKIVRKEDKILDIFVLTDKSASQKLVHKIKFAIDFDQKPVTISDVLNAFKKKEGVGKQN